MESIRIPGTRRTIEQHMKDDTNYMIEQNMFLFTK